MEFSATDDISGVKKIWADLDGVPVVSGQVIDSLTLALGNHTLTVHAIDKAYNESVGYLSNLQGGCIGPES